MISRLVVKIDGNVESVVGMIRLIRVFRIFRIVIRIENFTILDDLFTVIWLALSELHLVDENRPSRTDEAPNDDNKGEMKGVLPEAPFVVGDT